MTVIKLEHARALKRINAPLDTPVEEREFSKEYSTRWVGLMNAQGSFMCAVAEYCDGPRAGSPLKWRLVGRRLKTLNDEIVNSAELLDKLSDETERQLLAWFIAERAGPFIKFWLHAMLAVNDGNALTIKPDDIPPWVDKE